ncbi:hypothetical protein BRC79_00590 [Halobacteriales archaeon QH_8_67_27]|nr:MAG: hypothetical protein BRC79_00590 [Halobacteriales archaeon QH_8_67_27]
MIGYRVRQFLAAWREEGRRTQAFLLWNATNTVVAVALLVGAFALLVLTSAPGFQRNVLLAYIVVADIFTTLTEQLSFARSWIETHLSGFIQKLR